MDTPTVKIRTAAEVVASSPLPPFTVTVAGFEGTGKTTLALSISEVMPVYVLETEKRLQYLLKKMGYDQPKHPINVIDVTSWNDVREALPAIVEHYEEADHSVAQACVVIDSGTDYKNMAHREWEASSKTFPPTQWHNLYKMLDGSLHFLKSNGLSVILTARNKPLYVDDKWDGTSYRPDLFKNQRYISDAIIDIDRDGEVHIAKNSWGDVTTWKSVEVTRDMGMPTIIDTLMQA